MCKLFLFVNSNFLKFYFILNQSMYFLAILGYYLITFKTGSGKSLGWGEVNLNLTSGAALATSSRRWENLAPLPYLAW